MSSQSESLRHDLINGFVNFKDCLLSTPIELLVVFVEELHSSSFNEDAKGHVPYFSWLNLVSKLHDSMHNGWRFFEK